MALHPPVTPHGEPLRFDCVRTSCNHPRLSGAAEADAAVIAALLRAITRFKFAVSAVNGTNKLIRNKAAADRARVAAALDAAGNAGLAAPIGRIAPVS